MLLSLSSLITAFRLRPSGVLHLGAHLAEEAPDYFSNGLQNVVWVEGNPELIGSLTETVKPFGHRVVHALIDETSGADVEFKVTTNTQSSSILALGTHRDHHPEIEVGHTLHLETMTIDDLARVNDFSGLDFMNIDLQGAELRALRGAQRTLADINYVYCEVNREEVYEACALIEDVDAFLGSHGFRRVITEWTPAQWGDALYIRNGAPARRAWLGRARYRFGAAMRLVLAPTQLLSWMRIRAGAAAQRVGIKRTIG